MFKPITTAIAGFGMSGEFFMAPFIAANPGFNLTKILERHSERSKQFYPSVKIVKSFNEIINDNEIELVIISTPNSTHFEFGKKALLAGKNVIIEKPFTLTSNEAKELISIAEEKKLILSPFQNRRWDGDYLTVKKIIDSNVLGELVEFRSHFDRFRNYIKPNTWKEESAPGSGLLYDIGPHLIDQALQLFGNPVSLYADLRTTRSDTKIIDNFELVLNYGRLKVILNSGYLYHQSLTRFALFGSEGSYLKNGLDPQEDALKLSGYNPGPDWGKEPESMWGTLSTYNSGENNLQKFETIPGSYQDYFKNIHDSITNQKELIVKPTDALQSTKIIELAQESHNKKCSIKFP